MCTSLELWYFALTFQFYQQQECFSCLTLLISVHSVRCALLEFFNASSFLLFICSMTRLLFGRYCSGLTLLISIHSMKVYFIGILSILCFSLQFYLQHEKNIYFPFGYCSCLILLISIHSMTVFFIENLCYIAISVKKERKVLFYLDNIFHILHLNIRPFREITDCDILRICKKIKIQLTYCVCNMCMCVSVLA